MIITRIFAMPNKNTFSIKPIKELIERYYNPIDWKEWLNPFSNTSLQGITNDLNPEYNTDFNLEYLDFFREFEPGHIHGVFVDPPFSPRQISECYKGIGLKASQKDTQGFYHVVWGEVLRLKPKLVIQFGWHTNGRKKFYDLIELLIVNHGDHIMTPLLPYGRKRRSTNGDQKTSDTINIIIIPTIHTIPRTKTSL